MNKQPDESESWDEPPSKSAKKREMKALQELGEALVELDQGPFESLNIDDTDLLEAIATARRINSREGRRRQLQYIGKLMRGIDVEPIRAGLEDIARGRKALAAQFHELESLRDRALEHGTDAIGDIVERFPNADRQHLRQLIIQARKERDQNRPPAAARKLFKYLRELLESV